jgi:hypothetical protein
LPGKNACRVTESYVIPRIWQLSDDKQRYRIFLRPDDIYTAIGSTISPQRRDPLGLSHPNTVLQEINVQMFEDWPFEPKANSIASDFFQVRDEPTSHGSFLQLSYAFESRKSRVEVSEFQQFNEAIDKAKDSLGYTLTFQTPDQIKAIQRDAFNWSVAAAAFCCFGGTGFMVYRYFRDSKLADPIPLPDAIPERLNGIRGWLILLAVGHVLRPFSFIKTGFDLWPTMFKTNAWRLLTDPIESSYHPWWAPTLLYELLFTLASLVFCILLIALFFRKRAVWRRCFVLFLAANLVGSVVDAWFTQHIPAAARPLGVSVAGLIPLTLGAAIWVPYVYRSKRVKATFRN